MDLNLSLKPEIAEKASKVIAIIKSKTKPIDIGKSFKKLIGQIKKKNYGKVSQELKPKVLEETVNLSKKFGEKVLEPITRPKEKGVTFKEFRELGQKGRTVDLTEEEKNRYNRFMQRLSSLALGATGTLTEVGSATPALVNSLKQDTVNQLERLGLKQESVDLNTMNLGNTKTFLDLFKRIRAVIGEVPLPKTEVGSFLYEMFKASKFIK